VPYERRALEAVEWRRKLGIAPASADQLRICLLLIDVQNTFCLPGFELFVGGKSGRGAVEDCQRIAAFIYRNLPSITRIVATLDTHQAYQIFHSLFFEDKEGAHPDPYTRVTVDDIRSGRWRVSREAAETLGVSPEYLDAYVRHYVEALERGGKYELTIWPFHAMLGGIGHALVSLVEESIFFHCVARSSQPLIKVKGFNPLTEHYSALGPEVKRGPGGEVIGDRDEELVSHLITYDAIIIAGEAKSHCVAWTISDLIDVLKERRPSLVSRLYLLEDCTSPVVVAGVVDYTAEADLAFKRFADEGAHIVRSTEPLSSWPGLQG